MDSQECLVKDSVVFSKEGFKIIELTANYGDMGSNPGGPREWSKDQPEMNFPELEIMATHIKCSTNEWLNQPITRLQALEESDPFAIDLGKGVNAFRVLGTKDPVTDESIDFPKPIWVYSVNQKPYSLGVIQNKNMLEKIALPLCKEHSEFWDNSKKNKLARS